MFHKSAEDKIDKRLRFALLSLLQNDSAGKITVTKLCDRALLSRAAFYMHYEDIDDFIYKTLLSYCSLMAQQGLDWLFLTGDKRESSFKRKNLLFCEEDRELFGQLSRNGVFCDIGDEKELFDMFFAGIAEHYGEVFVKDNNEKLIFFVRSYMIFLQGTICNYEPKKAKAEISYISVIWDRLFSGMK